jgi:hypothetical protein
LDWLYQNVEEFEKRVCQKLDRVNIPIQYNFIKYRCTCTYPLDAQFNMQKETGTGKEIT